MNEQGKKALINVAEWLEAGAKHVETPKGHKIGLFDMEQSVDYNSGCGTACCIAGAVVQFENLIKPLNQRGHVQFFSEIDESGDEIEAGVGNLAKEYLGISEGDADELFLPWDNFDADSYTEFSDPDRAAKVIRHYIETGVVDWDLFPASEEYCDPE